MVIKTRVIVFFVLLISNSIFAQVTNVFSPVTAFTLGTQTCTNPGTPATSITISTNNAAFAVGNTVLIIQMKGASVNTTLQPEPPTAAADAVFGSVTSLNAAGNYEFAVVATTTNTGPGTATLTFTQPLVNTYTPLTDPVQLVSVPQYTNLTISAPLTGTPWGGTTGGVLVFQVGGTLTLNANISMNNSGFRGGAIITLPGATACNSGPYTLATTPTAISSQNSAGRGEGIVTNADLWGRGAMANGGGGGSGHNGGGAGGGNYCAGGRGGYEYSPCYATTGAALPYFQAVPNYVGGAFGTGPSDRQALPGYAVAPSATKVFMGGGGGAGNGDDGFETPGGNGGGIIIISADEISGTGGTISANGEAGWTNGIAPYAAGVSDGVGGGGAGGSVLLNVSTYTVASLSVQANGGKGGSNDQASTCHGTGAGGGAGYVALSTATPSNVNISAKGGAYGLSDTSNVYDNNCHNSNYGSEAGSSCATANNTLSLNTMNCPCSAANLGPDQSLCGSTSITLKNGTASNTNKTFTWYLNGTQLTGAGTTGPTYIATTAGLYKVIVDSMGCIKTSEMNITNTLPVPYLGPNQTLCNPSFLNLSTPNAASFPSVTKFQWYLNGVAIAGDTNVSLPDVTAPGTYKLTATVPGGTGGCAQTFAQVTLTSTSPVAVNACRSTTGSVTLSITNTLTGGPYNWYATATGGGVLLNGSNTTTYTTPSISATTTYYVEDDGYYDTIVGPTASNNGGFSGINGSGNSKTYTALYFNALKTFYLKGITVTIYTNNCACTTNFPIWLDITNSTGTVIGTGKATVNCCPTGISGGPYTYPITFTTPVLIPAGNNYTISANATTGYTIAFFNTGAVYTESYTPVFNITGNANNSNPTGSPSYFDWNVSYQQGCDRIPVVATISPTACPSASPVKLINFTAELISGKVELNWSTAQEINNNYFIVQRSTDGSSFETIDTIKGHGNSSAIIYYQCTDNSPLAGTTYYRLIQVDYNGDQTISSLASVNNDQALTATIYPNPYDKAVNLIVSAREIYKVQVQITDLTGKTLYTSSQFTTNETITLGQELTTGMYILEVISDYDTKTFKIVKE